MEEPEVVTTPNKSVVIIIRIDNPVRSSEVDRQRRKPDWEFPFIRTADLVCFTLNLWLDTSAESINISNYFKNLDYLDIQKDLSYFTTAIQK